ncbi:MAG: hypothetical protein ACFUZC_01265 [Chthoniobacteraceae bacterium]
MKRIVFMLLAAVCAFAAPVEAAPPSPIAPPFGLNWGLTKDRLSTLLKGANAKVVERRMVAGREAWNVEGLVLAHLRCTVFYFRGEGLDEAELQYQDKNWLENDYNDFLNQLRTSLDGKFGPGKLIARSKNPLPDGVIQTLTGYEWVQPGNAVQLVFFSAENPSEVYRLVSLHYKELK